jgi:hypothetical protein
MDLATTYLGLPLRNPLVASASPLSQTVAGVQRLAAAGVGAVVLPSLFEEQLRREAEEFARLTEAGTDSFPESLSYLPSTPNGNVGSRRYLSLLERATEAVDIPVIASLNGTTATGWTDYASALQEAGAAAIAALASCSSIPRRACGTGPERRPTARGFRHPCYAGPPTPPCPRLSRPLHDRIEGRRPSRHRCGRAGRDAPHALLPRNQRYPPGQLAAYLADPT